MHRFIANENLTRFENQFRSETDPSKRYLLRMLLVEEINRFAAGSERSQLAERHIAACNLHIAKQKVQVEKLNGGGNTVPLREAKRILINLLELRELYEKVHDVIADGVTRSLRDLASASTRDPPYERVN